MGSNVDVPAEKRAIRLRIGRARRRIDRRLRAIEREGRRVASWRTWLRWPPARSLLASLGIGLAASAGKRPRRWMRTLGHYLARRAGDPVLAAAIRQFAKVLTRSVHGQEESSPEVPDGGEHG